MRVALVHDYLNEFGGAERVLEVLCEIWPDAPIYTAFYRQDSDAHKRFKDKKIITSWAQNVPFFASFLHSPLRFLAPLIWNSFDFSDFDVVITSASWYVTKGVVKRKTTNDKRMPIEVCYCHTPPRYLYGYSTAKKYNNPLISAYALLVNHFMRVYDFEAAQRVDWFIANSREVQARIKKFYRRESVVIYPPASALSVGEWRAGPPVEVKKFEIRNENVSHRKTKSEIPRDYFLVVSRLVGAKNIELAVEVCSKLNLPLKVVGVGRDEDKLKSIAGKSVEFLGYIDDVELAKLYAGARAFLALAEDEDFGITPVEAMTCGTPVIAYAGGGYKETVVERKTGLLMEDLTPGALTIAINNFVDMEKKGLWKRDEIRKHAQKFGKERFMREMKKFVESKLK